MSRPEVIRVLVPSRVENLDFVQSVAEAAARLAGFDCEAALDLGLAVREGTINAMKHAHRFRSDLDVELGFRVDSGRLDVTVKDRGEGFDPASTPDPTAPENLWRTSGRGLLLIRSLVDEVEVSSDGEGTCLRLSKRRSEAPQRGPSGPADGDSDPIG